MPGALRQIAVDGMVSKPATAEAFARRISAGAFQPIDPSMVERLSASLGTEHPAFLAVLESVKGLTAPAIRLPGKPGRRIGSEFLGFQIALLRRN